MCLSRHLVERQDYAERRAIVGSAVERAVGAPYFGEKNTLSEKNDKMLVVFDKVLYLADET